GCLSAPGASGASAASGSSRAGTWAEALVGTNDTANGIAAADAVLAQTPNEPHALFARAWGMSMLNDPNARAYAERAVQANRGLPAELLLGLILFRAGDLDGAKTRFDAALKRDPNN